MFVELTVNDNI